MVQGRLLDIAVEEFGAKGLDGASTRGIAKAAGTAMSSITYHYGGKKGLYNAAAAHIAAKMALICDGLDLPDVIAEDDRAGARAALIRLLGQLVETMGAEQEAGWSLFIVREQIHPTEAFDRIYAGAMGQMMDQMVALVCIATGQRDRRQARLTAMLLFGQALVVRTARATLERLVEGRLNDPALMNDLKLCIATHVEAILDRVAEQGQGRA